MRETETERKERERQRDRYRHTERIESETERDRDRERRESEGERHRDRERERESRQRKRYTAGLPYLHLIAGQAGVHDAIAVVVGLATAATALQHAIGQRRRVGTCDRSTGNGGEAGSPAFARLSGKTGSKSSLTHNPGI